MRNYFSALLAIGFVWITEAGAVSEWYSEVRSVRALGMGGASHALSDDESAFFNNPSGFVYAKRYRGITPLQAYFASSTNVADVKRLVDAASSFTQAGSFSSATSSSIGQPLHGGGGVMAYYMADTWSLAFVPGDIKGNFYMTGPVGSVDMESTLMLDTGVYLSFFEEVAMSGLSYGFTLKGLYRNAARTSYTGVTPSNTNDFYLTQFRNIGSGFGLDGDFGASKEWRFLSTVRRLGVSISLNDIVATSYPFHGAGAPPPGRQRTASFGFYAVSDMFSEGIGPLVLRLEGSEYSLGLAGDPNFGDRNSTGWKHLRGGLELYMGPLTLRGGYYQGSWTAGAGLFTGGVRVELASYAEQWGSNPGDLSSRRFLIQFGFGYSAKRKTSAFGFG